MEESDRSDSAFESDHVEQTSELNWEISCLEKAGIYNQIKG